MDTLKITPLPIPINKSVTIPGSKSYTNRALLLAALSTKPVKILNPLISGDTDAMINCLKKLGIKVIIKKSSFEVLNNITAIKNQSYDLNANESGTTLRFILALSTIIPGVKTLYGEEGLNKRPIGELVTALQKLGANIKYLGKKGHPPVQISSSKFRNETIKIKGSISSQYISAILMIAPILGEINIEVAGNQISTPYIDMTIDAMKQFGVTIINKKYRNYLIPANQRYTAKKYTVEADYSSASYFLAIAALTYSTITLKNINPISKQADKKFIKILEKMGNKIEFANNQLTIQGKGVKPVSVDMTDCPDQIQTLTMLAAFAKGVTKIFGIKSLRIKETDRVAALQKELKKMNIKTSANTNTLTIYGGSPKPAKIETYGDHRMAMSFAVTGAKLAGIEIVDPNVVSKTFPDFWKKLNSIGIKTKTVSKKINIVLIGMRGSGKTTIAKLLSQKLNRRCLELDNMVVKKVGLPIPIIVEKHGWDFFRNKESEIAKKVSLENNIVISTGGGIILRQENIYALKENGVFILLNASVETLAKRIEKYSQLPPLTDKKTPREELGFVLEQREALYKKAADIIIDTDNLNPLETTDKIISEVERIKL
ncbi:3-phosphoshikimate 1-carboxyvinyltransferase [Candidatus Daviesbacteria bacterium]|nr:3-phosphoshikimate 1-carboxyvinyltransferase [Candidatus Daviesbacteria bacterium]